jgi:hypothetical protein
MAKAQASIRRSIERLLLPELERRGFAQHPDPELDPRSSTPFGKYLRPGVRGTDVIQVHFDKYDRTRFRLRLRVIPPGRTVEEPWLAGDPESVFHDLTKRGLFLRPCFGVRRRQPAPGEQQFDAAVNEVIELLPEVEELFRSGRATRRMQRWPMRSYGVGSLRFPMWTWIIWSIPVALLMFIIGAVRFIADHRPYEGSLTGWAFFAGLLLAGWIAFAWRAFRS